MTLSHLASTSLALISFASLAQAGILTVGPAGSSAQFGQLSSAIVSAAPGDTILVAAGSYQETTLIVVDKPLTIIGAGSAQTSIRLENSGWPNGSKFVIQGLLADESVSISGIEAGVQFPMGVSAPVLSVRDCVGPVLLQDVRAGDDFEVTHLFNMEVKNSTQVVLEDCSFSAVGQFSECAVPNNPDVQPMYVFDSTVYVHASEIVAGHTSDPCFVQPGFPAVLMVGSTMFVSDSVVRGSDTRHTLSGWSYANPAFDFAGTNELVLFGATSIEGGSEGYGSPALDVPAGTSVGHTPDVTFTAGAPNPSQPVHADVVLSGGSLSAQGERWGTLTAVPHAAGLGGSFALQSGGEANSFVKPFFAGQLSSSAATIFGVSGVILLDLASLQPLPGTVLDAMGQGSQPFTVPTDPALSGTIHSLQGLAVSPLGGLSISNATHLAVL